MIFLQSQYVDFRNKNVFWCYLFTDSYFRGPRYPSRDLAWATCLLYLSPSSASSKLGLILVMSALIWSHYLVLELPLGCLPFGLALPIPLTIVSISLHCICSSWSFAFNQCYDVSFYVQIREKIWSFLLCFLLHSLPSRFVEKVMF